MHSRMGLEKGTKRDFLSHTALPKHLPLMGLDTEAHGHAANVKQMNGKGPTGI